MKIPSYLIVFACSLLFLTFSHFIVLYKYFLVLIHHGLYACQAMAKSLNIQLPSEYGKILAGVLLLAATFTFIKFLGLIGRVLTFRKILTHKHNEHSNDLANLFASLGLQDKVLLFTQAKPQAFCFGIRHPKIYLSTGLIQLMDQKELILILRHEKYHLEHKDTLTLLLATIIESLFPFFPVVSDFIRVYKTDREIAADKAAIVNSTDKQTLKDVLKKLIQYEPDLQAVFLPSMMSADTLETRIRSMTAVGTTYKKIGLRKLGFSVLSLTVLLGLMITPIKAIEIHEDGQDVVLLCNSTINFSIDK